jgi:hypothetical protein
MSPSFATGWEKAAFMAAYASGEARLADTAYRSRGIPARTSSAPDARCRIETMPGKGNLIRGKSR